MITTQIWKITHLLEMLFKWIPGSYTLALKSESGLLTFRLNQYYFGSVELKKILKLKIPFTFQYFQLSPL